VGESARTLHARPALVLFQFLQAVPSSFVEPSLERFHRRTSYTVL
jgi:phosphotransferase system HPr-like phosphotransfer protein